MSDMETFRLESERDRVILTFLPHLNKIPWSDIEHVGTQVIGRISSIAVPKVIVDLSELDYMGSAQVALIVRIFKALKERQGTLIVCVDHPVVQEVLTLAGLHKLWTIVRSREEALARLGATAISQERASPWPALLGFLCAAVALLALIAVFGRFNVPVMAGIFSAILLSVLTFGLGLWSTIRSQGRTQLAGVAVLVCGVALLSGGMFALASSEKMIANTTQEVDADASDAPEGVAAQTDGLESAAEGAAKSAEPKVVPQPKPAPQPAQAKLNGGKS